MGPNTLFCASQRSALPELHGRAVQRTPGDSAVEFGKQGAMGPQPATEAHDVGTW